MANSTLPSLPPRAEARQQGLVVVEAVEVVPEPVEQARLVEQLQLAVVHLPRRVPHTCWCWPWMGKRRYRAQRRHPIRPDALKVRSMPAHNLPLHLTWTIECAQSSIAPTGWLSAVSSGQAAPFAPQRW